MNESTPIELIFSYATQGLQSLFYNIMRTLITIPETQYEV